MIEQEKAPNNRLTIKFCHGTGCVSGKAFEIREAMEKKVKETRPAPPDFKLKDNTETLQNILDEMCK